VHRKVALRSLLSTSRTHRSLSRCASKPRAHSCPPGKQPRDLDAVVIVMMRHGGVWRVHTIDGDRWQLASKHLPRLCALQITPLLTQTMAQKCKSTRIILRTHRLDRPAEYQPSLVPSDSAGNCLQTRNSEIIIYQCLHLAHQRCQCVILIY